MPKKILWMSRHTPHSHQTTVLRRYWKEDLQCDPADFPRALSILGSPGNSREFIQRHAARHAEDFEALYFKLLDAQASP